MTILPIISTLLFLKHSTKNKNSLKWTYIVFLKSMLNIKN